jgi:O-glycosyl hydrolase
MKGTSAGAANSSGASLTGQGMYVRTNAFADVAAYFKDFLLRLNQEGAPIFAISAGNETNLTDIRYEGMIISDANMVTLLTNIGPAIAGIPGYGGGKATEQVWLGPGEPSGGASGYVAPTMNNATARGYINFVGRHFYSDMYQRYDSAITNGKEVWMTEHSDTTNRGLQAADYPQMQNWSWVWHTMNEAWCSIALNDESAFVWWYSKRFYGFVGDGMYGSNDGVITNRGYAISHFSKFAADTTRVQLTASGTTDAGANLSTSNFNPTSFASGNSNSGGQNGTTVKALAFESMDGDSISVIMFTPSQNSGSGAVNMGTVQINLPSGFTASSAYAMRSDANVKCEIEDVSMNSTRSVAKISLPASTIVSVKFTR